MKKYCIFLFSFLLNLNYGFSQNTNTNVPEFENINIELIIHKILEKHIDSRNGEQDMVIKSFIIIVDDTLRNYHYPENIPLKDYGMLDYITIDTLSTRRIGDYTIYLDHEVKGLMYVNQISFSPPILDLATKDILMYSWQSIVNYRYEAIILNEKIHTFKKKDKGYYLESSLLTPKQFRTNLSDIIDLDG